MSSSGRHGRSRQHDADVLTALVYRTETTTISTVARVAQRCGDGIISTRRGDAIVRPRSRRVGKVQRAMSVLTNPGFWTGLAAAIGAVASLIAVIRHVNGPNHQ